ncbi:MAG: methyltransferase domain-containing protein [Pseudonocardiaceae bacterium]
MDITRFAEVDLTPGARFFVDLMDVANAQPDVRRLKPLVAEQLRLSPRARVLEVGCGTGDDTRLLASLVGETGQVVGIDASQTMIDVARERSRASSLPVEFALCDVCALAFPDNTFDACRCERVLMYGDSEPACGIAEMVRVTRPGGRVVISDFHWDALAIDHPDRAATRAVVHAVCDGIRYGWVGIQLPRLMADAGLIEIKVESHAARITYPVFRHAFHGPLAQAQQAGHLSEAEISEWWRPLDKAESAGAFMASIMAFITTGTVADQ